MIFYLYAVVHLGLLVLCLQKRPWGHWATAFLSVLALSLFVDNAVVGLGADHISESWYGGLTRLRYGLHAAVLPWLMLYGLSLPGAPAASVWRSLVIVICLLCFAYGIYTEVFALQLRPAPPGEVPRLVSVMRQPPWATILSNIVFAGLAACSWWRSGWPWPCVAALVILLINGASIGTPYANVLGGFAEIQLLACLIWTEFQRHSILYAEGVDNEVNQ